MAQEHFKFESDTKFGTWTKICDDMRESAAWRTLNRSQRCLYFELKYKFQSIWGGSKSKRVVISENSRNISYSVADAKEIYSDMRTLRADIDKLIECGFIDCISSGKITRECNIYGFTDRWKKYGTITKDGEVVLNPDYTVPPGFLRPNLTENEKKARKKAAERNRRKRDAKTRKATTPP